MTFFLCINLSCFTTVDLPDSPAPSNRIYHTQMTARESMREASVRLSQRVLQPAVIAQRWPCDIIGVDSARVRNSVRRSDAV